MLDRVDPPAALAEAEVVEQDLAASPAAARPGSAPQRHESSISCADGSATSGTSPSRSRVKTSRTSCRLHPRLEVVEQRVVGLVHLEARRVLAPELDVALEVRAEELEVVRRAAPRPRPGTPRRRARVCASRSSAGTFSSLSRSRRGDPDQARLVGVVVERLLVRPQLLEQLAELLARRAARGSTFETRRELLRRGPAPPRGGIIVCWSQAASPPSLARSQSSPRRSRSSAYLRLAQLGRNPTSRPRRSALG